MFTFYFAIALQKYGEKFRPAIWQVFLEGQISLPSHFLFVDYVTEQQWNLLYEFLVNTFKICDNKIPPIQPFRYETFSFLKTQHMISTLA
jgi:hypothetical protein